MATTRRRSTKTGSKPTRSKPVSRAGKSSNIQTHILDLQETAGNQATTTFIQRQLAPAVEGDTLAQKPLTHPLLASEPRIVQAAAGNSMTAGMQGKPVAVMQQALEAAGHTPANSLKPEGGFDGIWGGGTTTAVGSFQNAQGISPAAPGHAGPKTFHALDDVLNSKLVPDDDNDIIPPDILPVPPNSEVRNTILEEIMDKINLEYSKMLIEQTKALSQVERDLRQTEEAKPAISEQVLMFLAEKIMDGLLGGQATSLREAVKKVAADLPDLIKNKAVDVPFDKAKETAIDKVRSEVSPVPQKEVLGEFIGIQHDALSEANFSTQEEFINKTKPALREFTNEDILQVINDPTGPDPRIARAQKVLDGVKDAKSKAFAKQYDETITKWVSANAQETLGPTASVDQLGQAMTRVEGLREHTGKHSVPGILEIEFDFDRPKDPVKVTDISIGGLSEVVRNKLMQKNPTIGELNYPRRAIGEGSFLPNIGPIQPGTNIRVAKSETGDVVDVNSDGDGVDWYRERGDGNETEGIRRLFAEIDGIRIMDIAGGLQGP